MKRIYALFLAAILLLLSFVSCSKERPGSSGGETNQTEENQQSAFSAEEVIDTINTFAKENGFGKCSDFEEETRENGGTLHTFIAFDGILNLSVTEFGGEVIQVGVGTDADALKSKNVDAEKALEYLIVPLTLCHKELSREEANSFHGSQRQTGTLASMSLYEYEKGDWSFINVISGPSFVLSAAKSVLPEKKDLSGHTLTVVTLPQAKQNAFSSEIFVPDSKGTAFEKAVYDRNKKMKETYGCSVAENALSQSDLQTALLANEYVGDFIYGNLRNLLSISEHLQGMENFYDIASFHMGKVWWDFSKTNEVNLGESDLFCVSKSLYSDVTSAKAILYNKDLAASVFPDADLYETVEEGEWTVDKMYEMMCLMPEDKIGYLSTNSDQKNHFMASGVSLHAENLDRSISLNTMPSAKAMEAVEALRPLLCSEKRYISSAPTKEFSEGNALFCSTNIMSALNQSYDFQIGVLPFPKLSESERRYYTPASEQHQFQAFAVPKSVESGTDWEKNGFESGAEQSAYLLEVFVAQSHFFLGEKMQEKLFETTFSDKEDRDLLKDILKSTTFDPILVYDFGHFSNVFSGLVTANADGTANDSEYDSFLSRYGGLTAIAKKEIEESCRKFETTF